ncbi:hypothetical protein M527_21980 [Sphingobium indicum IP26]|uniref:DUF2946 domain-containing protein n=1 Tax=Sphingobium indicum F2 TaxID=1450518 RepID=A0A8E0WUZ2_9SPHN|nr:MULTISPECIES: DUF2946 family protein [Sphingobium]EPR16172.1 hypothetical protein M527_21980 [Sphingobium indicum IP26]EQB01871.1 hypothetical protein L286_14960 [Sphingobium sp. HDIP04]KER37859.1 hypothetical protein AL00_03165 [Sphingobium indicum F2]
MMGAVRRSESAKGLLAALALLVLAMQLLAPSGFMPVRTERGVVVTLCTGQGAVNVVVDRTVFDRDGASGKHRPDDGAPGQQHCPFAASVQPLVPPLALADLPLPAWQLGFGPIAFALKTGLIARLAAPPPPSSGPPAF